MVKWLVWLPAVFLLIRSFATRWFWPSVWPVEWSGRAWGGLGWEPVASSLSLAATVTLAALAIAVPVTPVFRRARWVRFVILTLALLPPLAAGIGLHGLFLRLDLTDQWFGVMLVHLIPAVPYAVMALAGSWSRFDEDLAAQARTLGANGWQVWRYVKGPALAPGLAAAALFAFVISWSQYALTSLIGGGRVLTLPMVLVGYQKSGDESVAAALSLVFLGPPVILFLWRSGE